MADSEVVRHAVAAIGASEDIRLRFVSFLDGRIKGLDRFLESMQA